MQGRDFLLLAREIFSGGAERHWRGAAGRAYYGLMLECREALIRWGFAVPPGESAHRFVRLRFDFAADADLKYIGQRFNNLGQLRNKADYNLANPPEFANAYAARTAMQNADDAFAMLDAIEADPVRLAAAVAAIRTAFP